MTIDEAVEIRQLRGDAMHGAADKVLSAAYLWLTDPTPLTVELIEAELGKCQYHGYMGGEHWSWMNAEVTKFADENFARSRHLKMYCIGDLRQIVSMLRRAVR